MKPETVRGSNAIGDLAPTLPTSTAAVLGDVTVDAIFAMSSRPRSNCRLVTRPFVSDVEVGFLSVDPPAASPVDRGVEAEVRSTWEVDADEVDDKDCLDDVAATDRLRNADPVEGVVSPPVNAVPVRERTEAALGVEVVWKADNGIEVMFVDDWLDEVFFRAPTVLPRDAVE